MHLDLIFSFKQGLPDPRILCIAYTQHPCIINSFVKAENHVSSWRVMREELFFFHQGLWTVHIYRGYDFHLDALEQVKYLVKYFCTFGDSFNWYQTVQFHYWSSLHLLSQHPFGTFLHELALTQSPFWSLEKASRMSSKKWWT